MAKDGDSSRKTMPCPKCQSPKTACYMVETGTREEPLDEYTLHCPDCGYVQIEVKCAGTAVGPPVLMTHCSFCGQPSIPKTHQITPANLKQAAKEASP